MSDIINLNLEFLPELERINAQFEDFTDFLNETVVVHSYSVEDVETSEGQNFESAVMWIELEGTGTFHLTRSSAFRVKETIKLLSAKTDEPFRCVFAISGKSHYLAPVKE